MVKIKKSKKAIRYIFEDKYFPNVIKRLEDGLIDPYDVYSWKINPSWGLDTYHFHMDKNGAEKVNKLKNSASFVLNITEKDDSEFIIIMINKEYGGLLVWMLDVIGFENYEDIKNFDPYKYDVFNEYITKNN